jgi:hypothetical protein
MIDSFASNIISTTIAFL